MGPLVGFVPMALVMIWGVLLGWLLESAAMLPLAANLSATCRGFLQFSSFDGRGPIARSDFGCQSGHGDDQGTAVGC